MIPIFNLDKTFRKYNQRDVFIHISIENNLVIDNFYLDDIV